MSTDQPAATPAERRSHVAAHQGYALPTCPLCARNREPDFAVSDAIERANRIHVAAHQGYEGYHA